MIETISEITQLWDRVLNYIRERLNDNRTFDAFFKPTYIDSIEGSKIIVVANSSLAETVLTNKFKELVKEAVLRATQTDFDITFVTKDKVTKQAEEKKNKPSYFADSRLDRRFSFESFEVGDCNREAHQAAIMVAKDPGKLFNPLLLYADSGLGKTHLMQSIGNAIKDDTPSAKVLYIGASDFVDEYMRFVKEYRDEESLTDYFKKDVDVFLIDDIQFLAGKKLTMEMFFLAFAALEKMGKQIVITADQHPSVINGLDDRLKSRFQAGLVISISRPDLETAKKILLSKIRANGLDDKDFDPEVITFLASRFSDNVRELEGSLQRLLFYTINIKPTKHITIEIASEAVQGLITVQESKTKLTEQKIIQTVADYYSLTPAQLTGKIRTSQIALARHIAMYLDKALLDTPFTKIGQAFGGKDHATVMKAVEKIEKTLKLDTALQKAVTDLKTKLGK